MENKINKIKTRDELKVISLGGLGEVGKNCYVIEYKNDIYVVDYGVLFPDKEYLGIDYIIPNYNYLKENESRIKAMFITHAHEDHIGGVPFLLKKVKIPVIYSPLTASLLIEKKMKEHKVSVPIRLLNDNSILKFGDVTVTAFHQTHSTPDSLGFFFETPVGNIATTGDFKVDFSPSGEEIADFHKMVDISKKGVMCLLSDSTNSQREGMSQSSDLIGENLKLLMKEAQGRILYTTFASHINRVQKIIEGALENNRKICVFGRSMKANVAIGIKTKYIDLPREKLIDPKEIGNYKPEEICILSTGSQGEELAALSRIANGLNPNIELNESDTVVFASNPIPGNNFPIGKIVDSLHKTGCKIIINTDYFKTHTSGHGSKEEQKLLLALFKPNYFMPIHGTHGMLSEHKKTAQHVGIEKNKIFILDNGDATIFTRDNKPEIKKNYTLGNSIFVSGINIDVKYKKHQINRVASDGIVLINTVINKRRDIISYPQLTTRGFVIIAESLDLLSELQRFFVKIYKTNVSKKITNFKRFLEDTMYEYILEKTKKKPTIRVNVIQELKNEDLKKD